MGDEINVNPDGLLHTAAHLEESAGKVRADHQVARSRGSVGNGAIGELFQSVVRRAEKVVEDVTETVAKVYEDSAKGLRKVAQQTIEDDDKAKSTFDGLGRQPEGMRGHPGAAVGGEPPSGSSAKSDRACPIRRAIPRRFLTSTPLMAPSSSGGTRIR